MTIDIGLAWLCNNELNRKHITPLFRLEQEMFGENIYTQNSLAWVDNINSKRHEDWVESKWASNNNKLLTNLKSKIIKTLNWLCTLRITEWPSTTRRLLSWSPLTVVCTSVKYCWWSTEGVVTFTLDGTSFVFEIWSPRLASLDSVTWILWFRTKFFGYVNLK